jgi:hypothetical protein
MNLPNQRKGYFAVRQYGNIPRQFRFFPNVNIQDIGRADKVRRRLLREGGFVAEEYGKEKDDEYNKIDECFFLKHNRKLLSQRINHESTKT